MTWVFQVSVKNGRVQGCLGSPSTPGKGNFRALIICYRLVPRLCAACSLVEDYVVTNDFCLLGNMTPKVMVLLPCMALNLFFSPFLL